MSFAAYYGSWSYLSGRDFRAVIFYDFRSLAETFRESTPSRAIDLNWYSEWIEMWKEVPSSWISPRPAINCSYAGKHGVCKKNCVRISKNHCRAPNVGSGGTQTIVHEHLHLAKRCHICVMTTVNCWLKKINKMKVVMSISSSPMRNMDLPLRPGNLARAPTFGILKMRKETLKR